MLSSQQQILTYFQSLKYLRTPNLSNFVMAWCCFILARSVCLSSLENASPIPKILTTSVLPETLFKILVPSGAKIVLFQNLEIR